MRLYIPTVLAGLALLLAAIALGLVLTGRGALKGDATDLSSGTQVNLAIPAADKPASAGSTGATSGPLQHMQLEGQYAGPLKDTIVQRWRDPAANMICYVYLPIVVEHSRPTPMGLVQYGANGIGSVSCAHAP